MKSEAAYGGKVFKTLSAGAKTLKIFKRHPGRCKGTKLVQKNFALPADADLTLVVTKKAPKVIIFDNFGLGIIPPTGPFYTLFDFAWRYAGDLGDINLWKVIDFDTPVEPSAIPIWQKGDQYTEDIAQDRTIIRLTATRAGTTKRLTRSKWVIHRDGRRYEWYLLGTKAKNAKFVAFSRAISASFPG